MTVSCCLRFEKKKKNATLWKFRLKKVVLKFSYLSSKTKAKRTWVYVALICIFMLRFRFGMQNGSNLTKASLVCMWLSWGWKLESTQRECGLMKIFGLGHTLVSNKKVTRSKMFLSEYVKKVFCWLKDKKVKTNSVHHTTKTRTCFSRRTIQKTQISITWKLFF